MTKEDHLEVEEQHIDSDQASEHQELLRRKKRIARLCCVFGLLMLFCFVAIKVTGYRRALETHAPEKLEAFLEYSLGQECRVEFNDFVYFLSVRDTTYIPYVVYITLKDGTKTSFDAYWKKNISLDDGVYTNYDRLLVSHYADKYGITYYNKQSYYELTLTEENLADTPSEFEQFMEAMYDSDYIQAGQELSLRIWVDDYLVSEWISVDAEKPVNINKLLDKISR